MKTMNRRVLVLAAVAALAVAACGPSLGDPRSSGIEGVPIPANAELVEPGRWSVTASYADLRAWYDVQMPVGANFTPWRWCEANTIGATALQRLYGRSGTSAILSVMIGDGNQPTIDIRVDDSGPC